MNTHMNIFLVEERFIKGSRILFDNYYILLLNPSINKETQHLETFLQQIIYNIHKWKCFLTTCEQTSPAQGLRVVL